MKDDAIAFIARKGGIVAAPFVALFCWLVSLIPVAGPWLLLFLASFFGAGCIGAVAQLHEIERRR